MFVEKWFILEEFLKILLLISWSLPDDEVTVCPPKR